MRPPTVLVWVIYEDVKIGQQHIYEDRLGKLWPVVKISASQSQLVNAASVKFWFEPHQRVRMEVTDHEAAVLLHRKRRRSRIVRN